MYVEMKPVRKADAKNILKAFDELVVHRWGCPQYLLTDNGTEFANKMTTERLNQYGVNRTLKSMISAFLKSDHKDWDLHLREFCFALNSMEHAATKILPVYLNFGRQPEPVVFLRKHLEEPQPSRPQDPETWLDRMKRFPALHDLIKRHLDSVTERQVRYYNRNKRDVSFQLNDLVLRRNHVDAPYED